MAKINKEASLSNVPDGQNYTRAHWDQDMTVIATAVNATDDEIKANKTSQDGIAYRMTTAEGDINTLETRATNAESRLSSVESNKTDKTGDHTGTWHGLLPSQANESISGVVDQHTEQIGSLSKKNDGYVNIAEYDSLSEAITDAQSKGIYEIYIPPNVSANVSDVNVPNGMVVNGEGTLVSNGTSSVMLTLGNGCKVKGIKFDLNGTRKAAIKTNGDNIEIDNVECFNQEVYQMTDPQYGCIFVTNSSNVRIGTVNFHDIITGVNIGYSINVEVKKVTSKNLLDYGVFIGRGSQRVTVDSVILDNDGFHLGYKARTVQWYGGDAANQANKDVFDLNNPTYTGVYDLTISNIISRNVRAAVWGTKGKRISVSNCNAHTVDDVSFDAEGSYDVTFSNCISVNANNGGMATFYGGGNVQFIGCKSILETGFNGNPWVSSTTYNIGDKVYVLDRVYECTVAGTSGMVAPTHTADIAMDGTVTWTFKRYIQISVFAGSWDRAGTKGIKVTGCEFINRGGGLARLRSDRGPTEVTYENNKYYNAMISALDQPYRYRINDNEFLFDFAGNYNAMKMVAYNNFEIKRNRIRKTGAESTPTVTDAAIYGTKNNNQLRFSELTLIEDNIIEGFAHSITTDQTCDTDGSWSYTTVINNKVSGQITRDTSKPTGGVIDSFTRETYVERGNYDQYGNVAKTHVKI